MELSEYRELMKNDTTPKMMEVKKKLTTRQALQAMSEFYEFDKKKTEFFIRQLELSGKI